MPRVAENQRVKFETDAVLRQLQVDTEIRYTNHHDCNLEEKRIRFRTECHEGKCKIGFVCNGVNLCLSFPKPPGSRYTSSEYVDFAREKGKVFVTCPLIFNGVCVKFCGYLDLNNLVGVAHLKFNETLAQDEDRLMKETLRMQTSSYIEETFDKG